MLSIRFPLPRCAGIALAVLAVTALSDADAQSDYGFDDTYSSIGYLYDTFGTLHGTSASLGFRHAQLRDGQIVVSGRVRLDADPVAPFWNIGLVRYRRFLGALPWEGAPGSYFWRDRDYVVYPNAQNGGTGINRIESVDDIAYAAGKIYVLVTRLFSTVPEDRDVSIVVFNEDGTFHQAIDVIAASVNEYGRAIDVKVTDLIAKPVAVTVLAERLAPGSRMVVAKFDVGSNGFLAADQGFNGGAPLQLPITTSCQASGSCNTTAGDLVRPTRLVGGDAMPMYVVGAVQRAGTDWDFLAAKVLANGTLDSAFGVGGVRYIPFDEAGSDRGDFAWSVTVDSGLVGVNDVVYIGGNVPRSCRSGVGFVALTSSGLDLAGFGNSGRIVHGGSTETGAVCAQDSAHYATQIVRQGNELALAGVAEGVDPGGNGVTDGLLVRVDAGSGTLRSLSSLPALDPTTGARLGRTRLWGITPYGGSQYMVSGEITAFSGGLTGFASARLQPADRIFYDGVDVVYPQQ